MSDLLPGIRSGVRRLFRLAPKGREAIHEDMDEELRFHIDSRVEQLVGRGLTAEAARLEALRRLGPSLGEATTRLYRSAEQRERRMAMREWLEDLRHDLRYAFRGLLKSPGFAATAVLTLAVGIGANTAIFSAVYALLLRPLPFREPERLLDVFLTPPVEAQGSMPGQIAWSFPKFRVFRDAQQSFAELALHSDGKFTLSGDQAERINGETVSARYLTTLGVVPALGRDFPVEEDAHGGAPRLAIVSDGLWKRRFDGSPAVIGRTARIDGEPFEIIGVLPPGFQGISGTADLLVPITSRPADYIEEQPWSLEFDMIGRLKPGVTPPHAIGEAEALGPRIYDAYPEDAEALARGAHAGWSAGAQSLNGTRVAPPLRRSLLVLFGAVGCVLLIACVNLANLLLGRATMRRREMAIRLAIGAGRGRLVRLLLTESLLLALAGGIASVAVAWWATRVLSAVNAADTLRVQGLAGLGVVGFSTIRLDGVALLFTLAVAVAVGVLFGLAPAFKATRPALTESLKDDGAGSGRFGGWRFGVTRNGLVVTEVALALVLLAGSGLMIRSLRKLLDVDPGFSAPNTLTLRMAMQSEVARDSMPGFYEAVLQRLGSLPGVTAAALADCPPLAGGCNGTIITFPDRPKSEQTETREIGVHTVTPGWFSALGVPLKRGRLLEESDRLGQPKVIVINESAARKYWPNQDPIGQRAAIWQGGFHDGATVVGVVGDVRFNTIDSIPVPDAFMSYNQSPRSSLMVFLRTRGDPLSLGPSVRAELHGLAPDLPVYDLQTMDSRIGAATGQARFSAVLLTLFAGVALALAVMGIYGVISFAVAQRTREIGIRMALGANRTRVIAMVVREGTTLAALGAAIGLGIALFLTRVLTAMLYDVTPSDPGTYLTIVALLGAAAFLACWVPARRAAAVEPVEALRRG